MKKLTVTIGIHDHPITARKLRPRDIIRATDIRPTNCTCAKCKGVHFQVSSDEVGLRAECFTTPRYRQVGN